MIPRPVAIAVSVFFLVTAASCINVNVPIGGDPSNPAVVWSLERVAPESWGIASSYVIRVKDFSSIQSLQRTEIVVILEDGSVNRASTDVWAARPMEMLPDMLAADLIDTGSWGAVLRTSTMLRDDYIVEGYIRGFGGVEHADGREAVLDVDVTVLDGNTNSLVFQKNYDLSIELSSPGYPELAQAMSTLVGIFNEELTGDIWSVMLPIR